jgi:hypothetical protein
MIAALAGALALAGVGADAVTLVGRIACGRHGCAGQEQGCCGSGDSGAGLGSNFHHSSSIRVFKSAGDFDRETFPGQPAPGFSYVTNWLLVTWSTAYFIIYRREPAGGLHIFHGVTA